MISLRSFVILSSLVVVVLALFFSWMQMKRVLEKGALTLEEKELDHISQVVRTAIDIKKSELRNYTRVARSNNDLASTYLIAKESGDIELVDAKLKTIQNDLHFDFSEILTPRGRSIRSVPLGLKSDVLARILQQKGGLFSTELNGEPVLISFSPLNLYGEPIAIVVLGYFLHGSIGKDLSRFTSADIRFSNSPPLGSRQSRLVDVAHNRLSFSIDGGTTEDNLWVTISLRENPMQSFWGPLSTRLILSGAVSLVFLLISLYCFLELGFIRGFRKFVEEVNKVSQDIGRGEPREIRISASRILENNLLFRACTNLVTNLIAHQKRMKEQVLFEESAQKQRALGELAQQVAHDIRSPISALEVATHAVAQIPEENRLLIRGAVSRIQDIANNLLARRKEIEIDDAAESMDSDTLSVQLLSCLIESIVSEKRMQLRDRIDIRIDTKLELSSYGLFASVQPATLKTVICNLLDNSVEAMEKAGSVFVHLQDRNDRIELSIEDNGKGIVKDLLPKLAQRGHSFNKEHGSGLGLYHARTSLEKWGGSLQLSSTVGVGTTVNLILPKAIPPKWFVPSIEVYDGGTIVVVDDDASIHQIWEKRFTRRSHETKLPIVHLSTPDQLLRWKPVSSNNGALYLVDYEFLGKAENGLFLIESLGIEAQSILVTSRHEDIEVVERCMAKSIRLIPKAMAGFVPVHFVEQPLVLQNADRLQRSDLTKGSSHAV